MQLQEIQKDLAQHHKDRSYLIQQAINKRLNKSLISYTETLETMKNFLARSDYIKVIKRLNKDM